jgi:hypothetical protein
MEELLRECAMEFFSMKKGEIIASPQETISVSRVARVTRRALKHFIESRVAQGNSWDDIDYLLKKVGEITENPQLNIKNTNQHNYPGSLLLGNFYADRKLAAMVVLDQGNAVPEVVSLYFTKKAAFLKLLKRQGRNG